MNKYLKELILWALILLPYAYLVTIWRELPDKVPTHFNFEGKANGWSNKTTMLFMPGVFGIGIYALMLAIPFLDPKNKIQQMGDKFFVLRFMLTLFTSALMTYLLYAGNAGSLKNPGLLVGLIGALFAMLGNYFQTIRPNYFIGIRTPWTLENEQVWKKTHLLSGRLWMVGGIVIVILSFLITNNHILMVVFGILGLIMGVVPVVFSYTEFKREKSLLRNEQVE